MGPNQTYKHLHSKGNNKQKEKTTYRMGENICKQCDQEGRDLQNIQTAHTIQQKKKKKQITQLKNGQKTYPPKKKYRTSTSK